MIVKYYLFGVFLTILWSIGIQDIVPIIYIYNVFPVIGLFFLHKQIVYHRKVIILIVILLLNLLCFQSGFKFSIKLLSYLSVFVLSYSLKFNYNLKLLKALLYLSILMFVINKFMDIFDSNFFFQRNSFPSFIFGLASIIKMGESNKFDLSLFLAVVFVVIFSSTIGALIALVFAYIFTHKIRHTLVNISVGTFGIVLVHYFIYDIELISRLERMYTHIFSKASVIEILTDMSLTYGSFATKSFTDVSALFRVFHWREILEYHFSSNISYILFGQGLDSVSSYLPLSMRQPPHNDILRVFVELGLVFGLLLFQLTTRVLTQLRGEAAFYMCALCFFLLTENLLNNYISSLPIFIIMGSITRRIHESSAYK